MLQNLNRIHKNEIGNKITDVLLCNGDGCLQWICISFCEITLITKLSEQLSETGRTWITKNETQQTKMKSNAPK